MTIVSNSRIMASPEDHEEIIKGLKVLIQSFIARNIIPCSETDIVNDKLPPETFTTFISFGLNLKVAVASFPKISTVKLEKVENSGVDDLFDFMEANGCEVSVKLEPDEEELCLEFSNDTDPSDSKPVIDTYEDYLDQDLVNDFSDDDDNYEPKPKLSKRKKVKKNMDDQFQDGNGLKVTKRKYEKGKGNKIKCQECDLEFNSAKLYQKHRIDNHFFNTIRGFGRLKSAHDHVEFLSHKSLLEKKEKYKEFAFIQIPPPDFTKDDFDQCVFPKPIEEYVITNFATKVKRDKSSKSAMCSTCHHKVKNMSELKEHQLKCHKLKFKCPYDNCKFNKRPCETVFLEFARHYFYHNKPLPQYNFPHYCLACDLSSPFIDVLEKHIKSKGPFHNNQCTRCDVRFSNIRDRQEHVKATQHHGYRCGWCSEVLDDLNKLNGHQLHCSKKPDNGQLCPDCGKTFSKQHLKQHRESMHGPENPQKCPKCDMICRNEANLYIHMTSKHRSSNEHRPCTECGAMIRQTYMNAHMMKKHTPDHLKPFVCEICKKGFCYKIQFENHMNTHYGKKPHTCKYCNRGFADVSNKMQHEKSTHEGIKRSHKGKSNANKSLTPDPLYVNKEYLAPTTKMGYRG